jgi:hypothetical protein
VAWAASTVALDSSTHARAVRCRGLWVAMLLAASAVSCLAADRGVHYAHGLLTVKLRGEPLAVVLLEVQRQTGVVVKGAAGLTTTLNQDIDQLPLVAALRVMLDGNNFLLHQGTRASDTRLIIVAGAAGRQQSAPGRAEARSATMLEGGLRDEDPAVRIDAVERLGERGDARSLSLVSQLLADPVDAVRAAAQQVISTGRASGNGGRRSP